MRFLRAMVRLLKILVVCAVILLIAGAVAAYILVYPKYAEYQEIADGFDLGELDDIPAISEVFDYAGLRYSRLPGETRYVVPLSKISPHFVNALLAREDSRFYEHGGLDWTGIARAAVRNFKAGNIKEGASTLTQQLARNTFDLGTDRWRKKFVEALLALRIEKTISKDKVIEAYANRIYYGVGIYGVETASLSCFGKPASDLTLSEAAILAGLIRSPNRLSPLEDTKTALIERDQVLSRMEELKMITPAEASAARAEQMPATKWFLPRILENYAMDAVLRDLTIILPKDVIDRGGLKIYTTLDRRLQMLAEDALGKKLTEIESVKGWPHPTLAQYLQSVADNIATKGNESPYLQGAMVVIDNDSGGLRAIVGGRDFKDSPYNRALLAKRQIGSTFKPFVYAAAFEGGMAPGTLVDDAPIREGDIAGLVTTWSPENSDGGNEGLQPAAIGLIRSRNTMTVRVGETATRQAVRDLALKAGMEHVPDIPAIYLGAFETTLKTLTAAYTIFPNDGMRRQAYVIDRIDDRNGQNIYKSARAELRCLTPDVNYVMNELLHEVVKKGTAASAGTMGLTVSAAGKTGTTNDYKDAWFVGYTSRLTCGVWVGLDRPQRIADRGYASKLALPVWVDFIENASSWKYVPQNFTAPGNLQVVNLCRVSGALATPECLAAGSQYQARLPGLMVPHASCTVHGGGVIAGPPTDGTQNPGDINQMVGVPEESPALRAEPLVAEEIPQPKEKNFRVIRKSNGFIFQNSR